MTTLLEEPILLVVDAEEETFHQSLEYRNARMANYVEVLETNAEAARVDQETLDAFLELVYAVDEEYIDAGMVEAPAFAEPLLSWEEMGNALIESQSMLKNMQDLLSLTLEEMGVEDHAYIKIYEDQAGALRLLTPHERQEEIEQTLNSPENRQLHELYRAVSSGMNLAGSLIGQGVLPQEVLDRVEAGRAAAAG